MLSVKEIAEPPFSVTDDTAGVVLFTVYVLSAPWATPADARLNWSTMYVYAAYVPSA